MLTLSSLKMSQLKSILSFCSLANHTKSFHCFTLILFARFVVQPLKSYHKTTSMAFPTFLLLSYEMTLFFFLFMVPPSPRPPATQTLLPEFHQSKVQIIPLSKFFIGLRHSQKISLVFVTFKSSFNVPPTTPASGVEVFVAFNETWAVTLLLCSPLHKQSMGSWRRNQCHAPAQVSLACTYL